MSKPLADEMTSTLLREKFNRYVPQTERIQLLDIILRSATTIAVTGNIHICRDPKDDMVLDLAVEGKANFIITGDRDLLVLGQYESVKIMSPVQFLQEFDFTD